MAFFTSFVSKKGVSVTHPLLNEKLPKKLEQERIEELIPIIKTGTSEEYTNAVKEIINGHLRLTAKIVGQYIAIDSRYGQMHDLISEAIYGIVLACHFIRVGKTKLSNKNLTGYVIASIHSRCLRFKMTDFNIRTARAKSKLRVREIPLNTEHDIAKQNDNSDEVMKDIISCCKTIGEVRVIKFRAMNYTNDEIGEMLGMSGERVRQILNKVKERYYEEA